MCIQRAIDSGKHVLFPSATYAFNRCLEFGNADQQCTFLAGAVMQAADYSSYVKITGVRQVIVGLRIEAASSEVSAHGPLVEIYGADDLVMRDLDVSVTAMSRSASGPKVAVRLMRTKRCTFVGGVISGSQESETIGLWLANSYDHDFDRSNPNPNAGRWPFPDTMTEAQRDSAKNESGAYEVSAIGLTIEAFGWAVRVGCITDSLGFMDCNFTNNVDGALLVRDDTDVVGTRLWQRADGSYDSFATCAVATGLNLVGSHLGGASPPKYVHVMASTKIARPRDARFPGIPRPETADIDVGGAAIHGGTVFGCTFGDGAATPSTTAASESRGGVVTGKTGARLGSSGGASAKHSSEAAQSGGQRVIPAASASSPLIRLPARAASKPTISTGPVAGIRDGGRGADARTPLRAGTASAPKGFGGGSSPSRGSVGSPPRLQATASDGRVATRAAAVPVRASTNDVQCVFRIDGVLQGVTVSGCRSEPDAERLYVWDISGSAEVSGTCDMFNSWSEPTAATGAHASELVRMSADSNGELTLSAESLAVESDAVGFFGAPAVGPEEYEVSGVENAGDRSLNSGNAERVLTQLLLDLGEIGLVTIKRRVR